MISYRWDGYSTKCAEGEVSVQYPLSLWYSGDKILIMKVNMMVQRLFAVLLLVVLLGLIPAENTQEVTVANAKELKNYGKEDHSAERRCQNDANPANSKV